MKKYAIRVILSFYLAGTCFFSLFSQSCSDTLYIRRNYLGKLTFAKFKINPNSNRKLSNRANFLKAIIQAHPNDYFELLHNVTDNLGITHKKYQLHHENYPVDGAEYFCMVK